MAKLKDIPFGSEMPSFDSEGYITLPKGLKDSSGNTIITMASGSAVFMGEACYASYAHCADSANSACYACCAWSAGTAEVACCAWSADGASYACEASCACNACYASEACCAGLAGDALYLSYCNSHLSPSYCNSLSAYLLV